MGYGSDEIDPICAKMWLVHEMILVDFLSLTPSLP